MKAWQTAHTPSRIAGAPVIYTPQGVRLQPVVGESFSFSPEWQLGSAHTTWTVSSGSLPDGLVLSAQTGTVSGTLTAAGLIGGGSGDAMGDYSVTLTATRSGASSGLAVEFDCQGAAASSFPDLVAHYDMDDISGGVFVDASGNGRDVDVNGTPTEVSSPIGGAVDFETDNANYGERSGDAALRLAGDMAVTWHHRITTTPHSQPIVSHGASGEGESVNFLYYIAVTSSGLLYYNHESGSGANRDEYSSGTVNSSGAWQSAGFSRDASENEIKFFIGGELDETDTYTSGPTGGGSGVFWIGRSQPSWSRFENELDELSIWGGTITDEQAATLEWLRAQSRPVMDWIGDV